MNCSENKILPSLPPPTPPPPPLTGTHPPPSPTTAIYRLTTIISLSPPASGSHPWWLWRSQIDFHGKWLCVLIKYYHTWTKPGIIEGEVIWTPWRIQESVSGCCLKETLRHLYPRIIIGIPCDRYNHGYLETEITYRLHPSSLSASTSLRLDSIPQLDQYSDPLASSTQHHQPLLIVPLSQLWHLEHRVYPLTYSYLSLWVSVAVSLSQDPLLSKTLPSVSTNATHRSATNEPR